VHQPPTADPTWLGLVDDVLPLAAAQAWATTPDCGAVVAFTGTVRDHSEGRTGVTSLTYEAYEGRAEEQMAAVVAEARAAWPAIRRVAVLHRVGRLAVGEAAVVVVVASAHRAEAFAAAEFCIDTVKARVPIWKREAWADGEDWGTCAHDMTPEPRMVDR